MSRQKEKNKNRYTNTQTERAACVHVKYVYMPQGKAMHATSTHE